MTKPIEILKAGTHTDSHGTTLTFGEPELLSMAQAYDPAVLEAPLVVGHPRANAPAYGWVKSLQSDGGRLRAIPQQVNPEFAELVNTGAYKRVSASLYLPDSPSNPKPGSYYLRHVGFLGAAAPAIKGLRAASFASEESGVVEFSVDADTNASLWRRMRDFFLSKYTREEADQAVPSWAVEQLERDAASADSPAFSETSPPSEVLCANGEAGETGLPPFTGDEMKTSKKDQGSSASATDSPSADFAEREQQLAARAQEIEAREQALKVQEAETAKREIAEFVDSLVQDNCRVLPADQPALVEFMAVLPADGSIEFSELGEDGKPGAKVTKPSISWFKGWLQRQPQQVDLAERAGGGVNVPSDDPQALAKAATEYQAEQAGKGISVSASEAVSHVSS